MTTQTPDYTPDPPGTPRGERARRFAQTVAELTPDERETLLRLAVRLQTRRTLRVLPPISDQGGRMTR